MARRIPTGEIEAGVDVGAPRLVCVGVEEGGVAADLLDMRRRRGGAGGYGGEVERRRPRPGELGKKGATPWGGSGGAAGVQRTAGRIRESPRAIWGRGELGVEQGRGGQVRASSVSSTAREGRRQGELGRATPVHSWPRATVPTAPFSL